MDKLTSSDYLQIATIHKQTLKNSGFLADCKISFISYFYKTIHQYDSSLILIDRSFDPKTVSGFIFFSFDSKNYLKKFLLNNILLIAINPVNLVPFIKAAIKKKFQKKIPSYQLELVHLAVDNSFQGKGIAKKLINTLENILINKNINEYYLQVFEDNLPAKNLYLSTNFEIISSFKYGKRTKLLMKKSFLH